MQSMTEKRWCACGKTCRGAFNFLQMMELGDEGIVAYYHGSQLDEAQNIDRTIFIIRNKKDDEMSSKAIQEAFDPNKISCPRCCHIYKRAQQLFKNIPSLAKGETIGICGHCAKLQQKHTTEIPTANRAQCKCKNVITRFLISEKERDLDSAMDAITKLCQSESKLPKPTILQSRKYHSDESLCKVRPCHKENFIEKQFSFVFPKVKNAELSHQISSSELIKGLLEKDGRKINSEQVESNKSETAKELNKSSRGSTPKKEKKVKDINDAKKSQSQKENNDSGTFKPHKEKEKKDSDTSKPHKEKENKDPDTSKPHKEKVNKDSGISKAQKEKESKDVDKSKPGKETKAVTKSDKEPNNNNNEMGNLLNELLSKKNKATDESEKIKKDQELAKQKAKLLADQKLKELTLMPVAVKVKNPRPKIKASGQSELEKQSVIDFQEKKPEEGAQIIVGQKILKHTTSLITSKEPTEKLPLFFKSAFQEEVVSEQHKTSKSYEPASKKPLKETTEQKQGIIQYALSDHTFIDKGWTMLPTEKIVRKMNIYRMRPAHPEFDWFEHNKKKREMLYDSGEKLAEFSDDGRGRWFYKNGKLALDYYNAKECDAQQRYVVYSNGEPDERGRSRPRTVLATFDYLGNGVVFDHNGKIRLKYNQTEGVLLDRSVGPVSHWKWHDLNDPPVLQQVMVDTELAHKDPRIYNIQTGSDELNKRSAKNDDAMLAIEFNNFIKEKSMKLARNFQPYQIKMKALKLNENFSLKILDQASVYLTFRDGSRNMKVNMGMVLDHKEIVDTDIADVGDVSNPMQRFPARTDSLAELQNAVAQAQRTDHLRVRQERRLHKPTGSLASADRLVAAASRPLRPPLITHSKASLPDPACKCLTRKPTMINVYYDNRIFS